MGDSSRRKFLKASSAASVLAAAGPTLARPQPAGARQEEKTPWYQDAWRRAVIDMHVPDWDEKFLSKFNPKEYARMLVRSRAQSIVCYCHSHVGLFNYPTKIGKQHEAFAGRNMMQEMIDACHDQGINVVLYCSLIFDRHCGDAHPEWRIRTWDQKIQGEGGRHAVLCVNSPYRDYVRKFTEEICRNFEFEGIRFDMTFWPWLCYCEHCKRRFRVEVGGELPTTINWLDDKWVAFQRCRERWLVEFAKVATDSVRLLKPNASVEHQSSTYPLNWMFGVTEALAGQNDFLQGDFYGDQLQGSFVRKLLERLTPNRPFGYETSFSVALRDHTAMKSESLLEAKASSAVADGAAFIFIDAIDPIGTVNHRAHERMGRVFERLAPCYEHLGGERVEDVAVYYSLESKFSFSSNGKHVRTADTSDTHTESCMHVASRLIRAHLPFGVLTQTSLDQLERFRVLILSNVHMMDESECATIRDWVRAGGKLIATGGSSLVTKEGKLLDDFLLSDVLGVSLVRADWSDRKHYLAPTAAGSDVFTEYSVKYPVYCTGPGFAVNAASDAVVLATTTLPWEHEDPSRFSAIHSDPPWKPTDQPEIVMHRYGKGAAVYCASLVENLDNAESSLVNLVLKLHDRFRFEVGAPGCVEATMFRQADRKRYVMSLVNFQKELPNIPVDGVRCRVSVEEEVNAVRQLVGGRDIGFRRAGADVEFQAPKLQTLLQFELLWT